MLAPITHPSFLNLHPYFIFIFQTLMSFTMINWVWRSDIFLRTQIQQLSSPKILSGMAEGERALLSVRCNLMT